MTIFSSSEDNKMSSLYPVYSDESSLKPIAMTFLHIVRTNVLAITPICCSAFFKCELLLIDLAHWQDLLDNVLSCS